VRWGDPDIGVDWPAGIEPLLSDKDRHGPLLREIDEARLPTFDANR